MEINRRQFLALLGVTTVGIGMTSFVPKSWAQSTTDATGPYQLPPLPYDYDALEPYIDAETMRFHHDKHHAGYTNKLNAAVSKYSDLAQQNPEDLLRNIDSIPEDIRATVVNNGGGYVNHKMYWEIMSPDGGGEPTGAIARAINRTFGDFASLQQQFNDAGSSQFGSGWAWLVVDDDGRLKVISTANQDSPLMQGLYPIMGNDVWEHAYYLKYHNDRGEYLKQWWNVVNWPEVERRYREAIA